jgi:hypothetical protein
VDAVTAYFARRVAEPQVVADLTADTFVAAITSFGSFDPRKGTARAWVFGIVRRVYASYCETYSQHQHRLQQLPAGANLTRISSRNCSTGSTPNAPARRCWHGWPGCRNETGANGRWLRPSADGIELFNLAKVPVTRYIYRGSKIPSPWIMPDHA